MVKHISSDGSTPEDRVKAFGFPFYGGAENISIGIKNPFEIVLSLIIDDGIKKRGHWTNVLNPAHRCGGIAWAHHKKKGDIFIITYAFYISSIKKGDVINKQISIWKEDDIEEAKEYGWDGTGEISSKVTFEFPHLVKTIETPKQSIILAKDLNRMVYKD